MPEKMPKYEKVDPRALISVPNILCPKCQNLMKIAGRIEVKTPGGRFRKGGSTPHLRYRCAKCRTEFDLDLTRRGGCFIATAAYGTGAAHDINLLRSFRDNYLHRASAGRAFISFYYAVSPAVAGAIAKSAQLRLITRAILKPILVIARRKVLL